jgi:hypothetical protein
MAPVAVGNLPALAVASCAARGRERRRSLPLRSESTFSVGIGRRTLNSPCGACADQRLWLYGVRLWLALRSRQSRPVRRGRRRMAAAMSVARFILRVGAACACATATPTGTGYHCHSGVTCAVNARSTGAGSGAAGDDPLLGLAAMAEPACRRKPKPTRARQDD